MLASYQEKIFNENVMNWGLIDEYSNVCKDYEEDMKHFFLKVILKSALMIFIMRNNQYFSRYVLGMDPI